jgi:uncharacterized protein (DUF849 family)
MSGILRNRCPDSSGITVRFRPDYTLLHGTGRSSWPLLGEAIRRGFDQRIGLEDVLVLPDGSRADGNAELVAAARALLDGA